MTSAPYADVALTRAEVDGLSGEVMLDFGTNWCGFCRAALSVVDHALVLHPEVRHIRVEDGSGRPLGRSFRVKLWPTLIFLKDGHEMARLVRPSGQSDIDVAIESLRGADPRMNP